MRLDAGARLGGKYRLLRRLAVGGMGEVWVARNEATGAAVAVKVLRTAHDEAVAARFRNEARLAARLSHRSIVRVFDWIETPGEALALVMELLRGESLARYLERNGPLSNQHAVAIMVPVLSALAHAHACGIIHRDIAPANIFLAIDPDGHVTPKIVDFGIAKLPTASTHTLDGQVLGTPRYMSPEQIRGGADLDGRSDLFGVGAVLYEAITGASPFAAPTPAASLAAVLEAHVDPDPRIEPRVWLQIQRALAKRPYERSSSAAEMAEGLRASVLATDESLVALLKEAPPIVPSEEGGRQGESLALHTAEAPHDEAPRETEAAAAGDPAHGPHSTDPAELSGSAHWIRARAGGWYARAAVVAALVASAAVAIVVGVRRPIAASSPAASRYGSDVRAAALSPSIPTAALSTEPGPSPEPASASTDAPPAPPSPSLAESAAANHPPRRATTPRPKAIATTPGF
jgi:serine/threonine-protein kinase